MNYEKLLDQCKSLHSIIADLLGKNEYISGAINIVKDETGVFTSIEPTQMIDSDAQDAIEFEVLYKLFSFESDLKKECQAIPDSIIPIGYKKSYDFKCILSFYPAQYSHEASVGPDIEAHKCCEYMELRENLFSEFI